MWKKTWLTLAEVIDAFRVVPRFILIGYTILVWSVVEWYMALPEPTTQQAALMTTVIGIIAPIAAFYQTTGRKWKDDPDNQD